MAGDRISSSAHDARSNARPGPHPRSWQVPRHPSKAWPPRPLLAYGLLLPAAAAPMLYPASVPGAPSVDQAGRHWGIPPVARVSPPVALAGSLERRQRRLTSRQHSGCGLLVAGARRGEKKAPRTSRGERREKERQVLRLLPCHWQMGQAVPLLCQPPWPPPILIPLRPVFVDCG
jgi:hypothetical protein